MNCKWGDCKAIIDDTGPGGFRRRYCEEHRIRARKRSRRRWLDKQAGRVRRPVPRPCEWAGCENQIFKAGRTKFCEEHRTDAARMYRRRWLQSEKGREHQKNTVRVAKLRAANRRRRSREERARRETRTDPGYLWNQRTNGHLDLLDFADVARETSSADLRRLWIYRGLELEQNDGDVHPRTELARASDSVAYESIDFARLRRYRFRYWFRPELRAMLERHDQKKKQREKDYPRTVARERRDELDVLRRRLREHLKTTKFDRHVIDTRKDIRP